MTEQEKADIEAQAWYDGYHDLPAENPYEEGTEEYLAWEEGYTQGCRDC